MPVSLLSSSHLSDLLVLVSSLLSSLPPPTASTLMTAQDTRYVNADTPASSLLPFSSHAFSTFRIAASFSLTLFLSPLGNLSNSIADANSALQLEPTTRVGILFIRYLPQ